MICTEATDSGRGRRSDHQPQLWNHRRRKQVKTHVDGAAQQSSSLQGLLHDLEQVGRRLAQVVVLGDASGEVFEAFGGGAAGQRFVAAVDPEREDS